MRILRQHNRECRWTPLLIRNYRNKISGPLLDRIDIHIEVPSVGYQELSGLNAGEPSAKIRERVIAARNIQKERFRGQRKVHCNATMRAKDMGKFCRLKEDAQSLLKMAINELNFSARTYDRILKVARTIADLAGSEQIKSAARGETCFVTMHCASGTTKFESVRNPP